MHELSTRYYNTVASAFADQYPTVISKKKVFPIAVWYKNWLKLHCQIYFSVVSLKIIFSNTLYTSALLVVGFLTVKNRWRKPLYVPRFIYIFLFTAGID